MGLLDTFTGGKSGSAEDALKRAEQYFGAVKTPTAQELTLPELQRYVQAGLISPSQAQAYLQERNAFEDQVIPQTGTEAQIKALNQLSAIADAGPEGTPMQQAQMENSLQQMRTADQGQIGAIEQQMAARGVPRALLQAAMASQVSGQNSQQAHLDAVNAQAAAYQNALSAMAQGGALGGQLQGQQNQQANTVAQAANAMQQFNAQNQQSAAEANAQRQQQANIGNVANKQQVSNNNIGLANTRTQYNANLPQQVYDNQLKKAMGQAGAATNIGQLYQQQGQQNAGIFGGLINTGATVLGGMYGGPAGAVAGNQLTKPNDGTAYAAHGGIVGEKDPMYCADGAIIPGEAPVPGNSYANDTVPVMASPGEAFLSRETVAQNPEVVSSLVSGDQGPDFQDVVTLLKAMRALRMGTV